MITLALDASTYAGDVAILDGQAVLAEVTVAMKGAREERLMPAVSDALGRAGVPVGGVGRVVCGAGPGSFTSLRIAGAIAKGIASGIRCPLFPVPSLALIVAADQRPPGRYVAVLDALRGESYVGLYEVDATGGVREREPARIVPADHVQRIAEDVDAVAIGPSVAMAAGSPGRGIVARPRARAVAALEALLAERGPADLASWEPAYGRLAEAQVRWEAVQGRALPVG